MHSPTSWLSRNSPLWRSRAVDQRRLAVIDVGNDGNIANVVASHRISSETGSRAEGMTQQSAGASCDANSGGQTVALIIAVADAKL